MPVRPCSRRKGVTVRDHPDKMQALLRRALKNCRHSAMRPGMARRTVRDTPALEEDRLSTSSTSSSPSRLPDALTRTAVRPSRRQLEADRHRPARAQAARSADSGRPGCLRQNARSDLHNYPARDRRQRGQMTANPATAAIPERTESTAMLTEPCRFVLRQFSRQVFN